LDAVSEQFANYVFEMREDIWKCCVKMTREFDFWEPSIRRVGGSGKFCHCASDTIYDVTSGAAEENFAHEFGCGWGVIMG